MSRNALRLLLVLVVLEMGLALRVVSVKDSMLDSLSRQQAATAMRARSLQRHGVDRGPEGPVWRGTGGRPREGLGFMPRAAAWLYAMRGYEWPRAGRILSAIAGVLAAVVLGASFSGEGVEGRGAVPAVLLLVSPVSVFLGRSFVPDSLLVLFAASLTWALRRALHGRADGTALLVAMASLGAGLLASPPPSSGSCPWPGFSFALPEPGRRAWGSGESPSPFFFSRPSPCRSGRAGSRSPIGWMAPPCCTDGHGRISPKPSSSAPGRRREPSS